MPITRLYLVRHGQTDWNLKPALQGRSDIPLNETGRTQAVEAAGRLADVCFDAVYTSPLRRAVDTACLATGLSEAELKVDDRLVEISFGLWEGLDSRTLGPAFTPFFTDPAAYQPQEGSESLQALMRRTGTFAQEVLCRHKGQTVLAVSHGAALHALLASVLHLPMADFWSVQLGNCAIAVLENKGRAWRLLRVMETESGDYAKTYLK